MNWLLKRIAKLLMKICDKTGRTHYITEDPNGGDVYLIRYIVFKSKYFSIYIHRFMRSDLSDPHDHPWNFLTYILEGGYNELFYDMDKPKISRDRSKFASYWTKTVNVRKAGSLAYRKSTDIHQVKLDKKYNMSEVEEAPLTLCLIGKRRRQWGFWFEKHHGGLYRHWKDYLNVKPEDPRMEGSE